MNEEIKEVTPETPVIDEAAPVQEQQPAPKSKEYNLSAMRKKLEEEEAARKEAERRALEAERRASQFIQPHEAQMTQPDPIDEEFVNSDPDDVAYNKTVQKTTKKINSKISENEKRLAELQQKLEYFETKLEIDSLKDFNEVVSADNVKTFARLYPDEYQTIMSNPNLKSRSKMAYNMIKNYGIVEASPLLKTAQEIKVAEKKIEANKLKPSTASAMPPSPLKTLGRYDADGRLLLNDADIDRINSEVRKKLGY